MRYLTLASALLALIGAAGAAYLGGVASAATRSTAPTSAAPTSAAMGSAAGGLSGVRVEYVALAGNNARTDTICHLINRDAIDDLVVQSVRVIGPGGRTDPIAVAPGLAGATIPPLGTLRFAVDSLTFPGLTAQPTFTAPGARVVLVDWVGVADGLRLTSTIVRFPPGSVDRRTSVTEQGFDVSL